MKTKYLILLLLLTASCAPTIKNFDAYKKQFLTKTKFMPTPDVLEGKPTKVVIFKFDENGNQTASQAALGDALSTGVESALGKSRLVKLVDRKAAEKLQKEIALAEMNKTGVYKGPQIADFAVSGSITNAGFTKRYASRDTCFDVMTRQAKFIPPFYEYKSEVTGSIKIYELPSLAVAETIELEGNQERRENVQKNGGVSIGDISFGGTAEKAADRDDALVRKAGEDAVKSAEVDIKNFFGKRGYILEKRTFEDKTIFKISLGSEDGILHGDKLEVTGQYESDNAVSGKIDIEKRIIGTVTVANNPDKTLIGSKFSWVVADNAKSADAIRLGDIAKMKYKKSFLQSKGGKTAVGMFGAICGVK